MVVLLRGSALLVLLGCVVPNATGLVKNVNRVSSPIVSVIMNEYMVVSKSYSNSYS
jgi:hypothetical protein